MDQRRLAPVILSGFGMWLQGTPPPSSPIIVRVVETPDQSLTDVILSAVGLSGALTLVALLVGLLAGAAVILLRLRRRTASTAATEHQQLHLNQ